MSYWRGVTAMVVKDVMAEWRSREMLTAMLLFSLMVAVTFNLALQLRVDNVLQIAPGLMWVAFVFAGVLGLNRSFATEQESACIEGLMLTPVDRSAIYVAKCISNTLFMLTAEAICLPVFAILFRVPVGHPALWLVVLLGTVGFASAGTLFAAVALNSRAREILLPLLLLPIVVPVLTAATRSTAEILDGQSLAAYAPWLRLLLGFDIISLVIAVLTFEYVLEE
jgi:heme exporter protein B